MPGCGRPPPSGASTTTTPCRTGPASVPRRSTSCTPRACSSPRTAPATSTTDEPPPLLLGVEKVGHRERHTRSIGHLDGAYGRDGLPLAIAGLRRIREDLDPGPVHDPVRAEAAAAVDGRLHVD